MLASAKKGGGPGPWAIAVEDYPMLFHQEGTMDNPIQQSIDAGLCADKKEHARIVGSSMAASDRDGAVRVVRDPEDGGVKVYNHIDQEMRLNEEQAIGLYQALAKAFGLDYQDNCPVCGTLMEFDGTCSECAFDEEEENEDD
jgi:hypothetical protein